MYQKFLLWPVGQAVKTAASHAANRSSILLRVTKVLTRLLQYGKVTDEVLVGVNGDEGTPVPIPNTVVKLIYGDNTWLDTAWKDNSMPT